MKNIGGFFISYIICLAFVFRLLVISFIPGSTATVFPHTVSYKYMGLSSYQKRRRNIENPSFVNETVQVPDTSVLCEERNEEIRNSFVKKCIVLISGARALTFLNNINCVGSGHILNFSDILQQRKVLSVSALRI